MSGTQKLTDAQIAFARQIDQKRREAQRIVAMYPTQAQVAEQLGCSKTTLDKALRKD